jgi:hypothetical protein
MRLPIAIPTSPAIDVWRLGRVAAELDSPVRSNSSACSGCPLAAHSGPEAGLCGPGCGTPESLAAGTQSSPCPLHPADEGPTRNTHESEAALISSSTRCCARQPLAISSLGNASCVARCQAHISLVGILLPILLGQFLLQNDRPVVSRGRVAGVRSCTGGSKRYLSAGRGSAAGETVNSTVGATLSSARRARAFPERTDHSPGHGPGARPTWRRIAGEGYSRETERITNTPGNVGAIVSK